MVLWLGSATVAGLHCQSRCSKQRRGVGAARLYSDNIQEKTMQADLISHYRWTARYNAWFNQRL